MRRRTLSLAAASATLAVPATAALAAPAPGTAPGSVPTALTTPLPGPHDTVAAKLRAAARPALVDDVVRLARRKAGLQGRRLAHGYRASLSAWTPQRLRRERHSLRQEVRQQRRAHAAGVSATGAATPAGLQAIAACESGGNPSAVDPSGTYRGKYQFDYATWRAIGGTGDPAAASEAEQDRRAAMLYSRAGATPWPVCGR